MEKWLMDLISHLTLTNGLTIWVGLSLVVNLLLVLKGPEAWVELAKRNPTLGLVVNVLWRALGIDLVSVIVHLKQYLSAKAEKDTRPTL